MENTESAHDLKGKTVFILTLLRSKEDPEAIPFALEEDLLRHLGDLIAHQLGKMPDEFRRKVIRHLESKDYKKAIRAYRKAQLDCVPWPDLDFRWEEQPTVIM